MHAGFQLHRQNLIDLPVLGYPPLPLQRSRFNPDPEMALPRRMCPNMAMMLV